MRLGTFEVNDRETWGIVIPTPIADEDWIFEPERVEVLLSRYSEGGTSPYCLSRPRFLEKRPWPSDLVSFLALGDQGLSALRHLQDFLRRFLEQSDQSLLFQAGCPLSSVHLRAPIPRPRLLWGLVQNCPTFARNNPNRTIMNLFPQAHQRPEGTVVGPGEPVVVPTDARIWGFNVEMGIVIGKQGRHIPASKAMEHVAGYTVINDVSSDALYHRIRKTGQSGYDLPEWADWFIGATASWGGKKTDTMCPMGPFLVTKDEIGSPYDLLVYTRQSGRLRDRAHSGSLILGIERVISWYSEFATLYPGDVIHLATMGVDGLCCHEDITFGPDDYLECEIEKIGVLRNPVVVSRHNDWRSKDDPGRTVHSSPAIRDVIRAGQSELTTPTAWHPKQARNFWMLFGNYKLVAEKENIVLADVLRFLNTPNSALSASPAVISLPARTTTLHLGIELALVIKKVAHAVTRENGDEFILGYMPMLSVSDQSFRDIVREPATEQERALPVAYARWADGFNVVPTAPTKLASSKVSGLKMRLTVDGIGEISGSTDEYVAMAPDVLEYITRYITFFPGDVVTLGRVSERLTLPAEKVVSGLRGKASIDTLGQIEFIIEK